MYSGAAKRLLVFPCNGNGIEALDCLGAAFQSIAFVDDAVEKQGHTVRGCPVFGREAFRQWPDARVLAVPGSPSSYLARREIVSGLGLPPERFATVIHPAAVVSSLASVGYNVLVMAGVVITSNAIIGNHVCILPNAVVHHDSVVGDWSLVGSNVTVAGVSRIGENCYVGSGSCIKNGIEVGDGALVGMGSCVVRSVRSFSRVAGNPAKEI